MNSDYINGLKYSREYRFNSVYSIYLTQTKITATPLKSFAVSSKSYTESDQRDELLKQNYSIH